MRPTNSNRIKPHRNDTTFRYDKTHLYNPIRRTESIQTKSKRRILSNLFRATNHAGSVRFQSVPARPAMLDQTEPIHDDSLCLIDSIRRTVSNRNTPERLSLPIRWRYMSTIPTATLPTSPWRQYVTLPYEPLWPNSISRANPLRHFRTNQIAPYIVTSLL